METKLFELTPAEQKVFDKIKNDECNICRDSVVETANSKFATDGRIAMIKGFCPVRFSDKLGPTFDRKEGYNVTITKKELAHHKLFKLDKNGVRDPNFLSFNFYTNQLIGSYSSFVNYKETINIYDNQYPSFLGLRRNYKQNIIHISVRYLRMIMEASEKKEITLRVWAEDQQAYYVDNDKLLRFVVMPVAAWIYEF